MRNLFLIGIALVAVGCSAGSNDTSADSSDTSGPVGSSINTALSGVTEADLPVPFYPGSTSHGPMMAFPLPGGGRTINSNRVTTDSVKQVADFYKSKVKFSIATVTDSSADLTTSLPNKETLVVQATKGQNGTAISIAFEKK